MEAKKKLEFYLIKLCKWTTQLMAELENLKTVLRRFAKVCFKPLFASLIGVFPANRDNFNVQKHNLNV